MQTLFGLDLSTAQKVIVASVVILILLVLLGLFVRQIQGGRLKTRGQGGGRARQPRLGVVDAHNLDRQRQLILIRRDNVEHLIMIGGASDVVVETNIMRSGARAATQPIDYAMTERPQAFESLVPQELARQETVRQEPGRQEPGRQEPARQDPVRPEPVAVAQPKPDLLPPLPARPSQPAAPPRQVQSPTQGDAAIAAAAVVVPAVLAGAASRASLAPELSPPTPTVQPPSFARDHAPSPAASAVELDSMARQLEEALKRPFSEVRPANSAGEAPAPVKPAAIEVAAPQKYVPEAAPAPGEPSPAPIAPASPESSGRSALMSADVEAELELALGLKPERVAPSPPNPPSGAKSQGPEPVQVAEAEPLADEPLDDGLMQAQAEDIGEAASEAPEVPAQADPVSEPKVEAAPPEPAPAPKQPEPPARDSQEKPAAIDPFSVDAIEAEFARLLGRDPKSKS